MRGLTRYVLWLLCGIHVIRNIGKIKNLNAAGYFENTGNNYEENELERIDSFSGTDDDELSTEHAPVGDFGELGDHQSCPTDFTYMNDRILNKETIDESRRIPRTIHFIIQSRCIPKDLAMHVKLQWESALPDHSIMYHSQKDIDRYMSTADENKKYFPFIASIYKCVPHSRAKLDIARFLILWDYGGISVDIDNVPGPAFLNGSIIENTDESVFEAGKNNYMNPRFLASEPKHATLYQGILHILSSMYNLGRCYEPKACSYPTIQRRLYMDEWTRVFYQENDSGTIKTRRNHTEGFLKSKYTLINADRADGDFLTKLNVTNHTQNAIDLRVLSPDEQSQCDAMKNFDNNSFEFDIQSLIEIAGADNNTQKKTICGNNLKLKQSKFNPNSIVKGRKIPKIVHMTSKSKCFTPGFSKNIDNWTFKDHSIFIHDDAAVQRMFDRNWPEFPLLRQATSCLSSGAGKADLWRYLMLWEYGGIYTDIDNLPGFRFDNDTAITDEMDIFFEREREGFPSQYFFASSPHHPVMYFMVQHTIERLLVLVKNIKEQYVPIVTGPAATKVANMLGMGGSGRYYPGEYKAVNNRNITIADGRNSAYVVRSLVPRRKVDMKAMNMTNYRDIKANPGPTHSCVLEMHKNAKARFM